MQKEKKIPSSTLNKACSIFFYEGWIGVHPTVMSLAKLLNDKGYAVNVYAGENGYPKPGFLGENVQVFWLKKNFKWLNSFRDSPSRLFVKIKGLVPVIRSLIFALQVLTGKTKPKQTQSQSIVNIGIDIYGLAAAFLVSKIKRQKHLFLSLELKDQPSNYQGAAKILSKLVKAAYRQAEYVIVQDEDRFEVLCQQFEYRHPNVVYLPNSSLPQQVKEINSPEQPNYFREKFELSEADFPWIVLQAGMIQETCHAKTLATLFKSIDKCALVFHERCPRSPHEPYLKDLREINSNNLFLSLDPVSYEEVDKVYAASTIGLAFYQDTQGENFTRIAKASGKLNHYLKHGKPILVNALPSLENLVNTYQCGIAIQDLTNPQEIEQAIHHILEHYEHYSQNAKRCFDAEFNFVEKAQPILAFLEEI